MKQIKIFISSVQTEFAEERKALHEYLSSDPLLGMFFEPFLFEFLPALDQRADQVYLTEVERSDIYLGLLGRDYGFENSDGVSPTELEFDKASAQFKTRLIFLTTHSNSERHPKQLTFINKAQNVLVRKKFGSVDELKASVYAALVRYLEEKEIIQTSPFDATISRFGIDELDPNRIRSFVQLAKSKRGFPLSENAPAEDVLIHLNLMDNSRITNASLLLFGHNPQKFFITSEVRCASFHGIIVEKPIPSYKVFKGDAFTLVDQTVDFILSKLDYSVGTRHEQVQIPGGYEIPREIIAEAVVNAIAHRDYRSNGSVQVMLFSDRLEIWNPGMLPMGWTTEKLKAVHNSVPKNPLLAEPMYLAGYIERLGTGTADIMRISAEVGLKEPEFIQEEDIFKTIIYRPQVSVRSTEFRGISIEYSPIPDEIIQVINVIDGEMKRSEIMEKLGLTHRENFINNYLDPALKMGLIESTYPENPKHPKQKYRLTESGKSVKPRE